MGQLEKARVTRDQANIRAVREAGAVAILNDENYDLSKVSSSTVFYITATVGLDGSFKLEEITTTKGSLTPSVAGAIKYGSEKNIIAELPVSDINTKVKS